MRHERLILVLVLILDERMFDHDELVGCRLLSRPDWNPSLASNRRELAIQ